MFAHLLSQEERIVLVHLFAHLAACDHALHERELDPISMAAYKLGLDPQSVVQDVECSNLPQLVKPLVSEQAKRIVLEELIHFAYADGAYAPEERTKVQEIAKQLGISAELLTRIETWVEQGMTWTKTGEQLIL